MHRIQFDSLGRVIKKPQNYKGKKLIKLTNNSDKVINNVDHIILTKLHSGIYKHKDYIIQKIDHTIKYRRFINYDWTIYKKRKYIITVPTLERARQYFNSIKK